MGKSKAPLKKQQQRGVDFKVIPAVSTIHWKYLELIGFMFTLYLLSFIENKTKSWAEIATTKERDKHWNQIQR